MKLHCHDSKKPKLKIITVSVYQLQNTSQNKVITFFFFSKMTCKPGNNVWSFKTLKFETIRWKGSSNWGPPHPDIMLLCSLFSLSSWVPIPTYSTQYHQHTAHHHPILYMLMQVNKLHHLKTKSVTHTPQLKINYFLTIPPTHTHTPCLWFFWLGLPMK